MSWRGLAPPRYRNETLTSTGGYAAGSDRLRGTLTANFISVGANETIPWDVITGAGGSSVQHNGGGVFEILADGIYSLNCVVRSGSAVYYVAVDGLLIDNIGLRGNEGGVNIVQSLSAGNLVTVRLLVAGAAITAFITPGYLTSYFQIARLS